MLEYKLFSGAAAPQELYRFRYLIYVEEMGRKQKYACSESRTIRDPLDDHGHHGIIFDGDRIVGCIRMNLLREAPVGGYFDFYDLAKLSPQEIVSASICTRLMIDPQFRQTPVSVNIVKFAYKFGLINDVSTCFIDCNDHLVKFFQRFGWRELYRREHEEYGDVNVMRLDLKDIDHLSAIRSPLLPVALKHVWGPDGKAKATQPGVTRRWV